MDRPPWPQEVVIKPMEEILAVPNTTTTNPSLINNLSRKPSSSSCSSSFERRVSRPQKAGAVNCPRCDSTNTKFCYYNNYSLSQPRYFCKTCRRYWTEGGTLRNIPVGGGSRKNKLRSSSSNSTSTSYSYNSSVSKKLIPDLSQNPASRIIHHDHYGGQDLNLGFQSANNNFKNVSEFIQVPHFDVTRNINSSASTITTTTAASAHQLSALELLTGITTTRGMMNSFMPIPILDHDSNSVYSPPSAGQLMIPLTPAEFKIPSSLRFSLDGMGISGGSDAYGNTNTTVEESSNSCGMMRANLFPFEELTKTNTSSETPHDDRDPAQIKDQINSCDSSGFWNGMMGGGGSWYYQHPNSWLSWIEGDGLLSHHCPPFPPRLINGPTSP